MPPKNGLGKLLNVAAILVKNPGNVGYNPRPVPADDRDCNPFSPILTI